MSEARIRDNEALPKGRVNEVCQEWMVREDGALAYRLQNQEITEHLSGNKYRNALVREDFPRAKSEQLREQRLAEQTALIYQRMLAEQEEQDNQVARQLAEELKREERQKRRLLEMQDHDIARQLLHKERVNVERHQLSPQRPPPPRNYDNNLSPHRPDSYNYQANLPRRQAKPMPLPQKIPEISDLYTEPYHTPETLANQLDRIDIAEVGLPLDEVTERQIQEERDAELARKLQEQEGNLEDTLLNRDRMLAIEAQDKELAKMLQERERNKARRARERAKQKAFAKKQQLESQQNNTTTNQIMPDDSYSYPADLIPPRASIPRNHPNISDTYALPAQNEDDINYSLPVDVLPSHNLIDNNTKSNYTPQKNYDARYALGDKIINSADSNIRPSFDTDRSDRYFDGPPAVRPTQLDLKSPLNRMNKPRYPEPENCDIASGLSPNSQHINIAMAIDPTYPKRGMHSSSSYETTSSTVTTSTSSSSPGMVLPPPDISELEDESNIPPYMPIQGQRRTASLEKKQKKKNKDGGCKQQ